MLAEKYRYFNYVIIMKKQVIVIHGGDSFDSYEKFIDSLKNWEVSLKSFLPRYDWKMSMQEKLGEDFQVLTPRMPNKQNAKYAEWKIWFERMLPFIQDEAILVGHSQGGLFLVKYLSENKFPKIIAKICLIAPPHSETPEIGDFVLGGSPVGISDQCKNIHLFQSKDDPVVPFTEAERYQKDFPTAQLHIFEDRGHFLDEKFPELIEEIKET